MTDYITSAIALFDGGWRTYDRNELIREYELTDEEADKICELLATLIGSIRCEPYTTL